VLLYLHFEGRARPIPRDRLVDLLWPDVPPAKGRHSLSQALLAIRAQLGSDAVTGREQDVQLLAELPSDLSALRQTNVATLRVAEPLQGLEDCGGADFAHWVDGARVRLKAQARDTLRAALRAARATGNAAETHQLAAALYDIDPLCADAVYTLAERALLDRDTVAAVRLLKDHVERARAELGTNPNAEIARLLRRLERGERPAVASAPSAFDDGRSRPHPFVGREAELGRMEAIANRVAQGARPGYETCLITGPPGIGKSSLIRRFATSLQSRAWPVFIVPCQEIGQGIPYAAVAELITVLARDPATGGTEPLWLAEASRVCPGLRAIYSGVPEASDAPTDSIRLRVAEAVLHMLEAVSDNGELLLVFDDLQFIDSASQEVLFLMTSGLRRVRMSTLILAGARGGGGGSDGGGLAWATTIELQPLDRSQALTLIRDLSVDSRDTSAPLQETIVRLSQGNPYHIEMLIADWRVHQSNSLVVAEDSGDASAISWTPPEDLRAAFARQYGDLSSDAQHVLQVLAVAGKAMAPAEFSSLLGQDGGVSQRVVLEMLDRGVGRVEEGKLSFKNELHRAYVYHAMGNDRRTYHHAQLAQRLAGSPDREQLPVMLELAHHSICAGLEQEAMGTALEAAEVAIARGAPREAERVLTRLLRAFAVAAGSRLRLLLAHAFVATGQYQQALDALADWQPPPDAASATDRALAALLRANALQRARLGGDAAIIKAAQDAVALAEEAKAASLLVRANHVRMEVGLDGGDVATQREAESLAARIAASDATPECIALANLTVGGSALARREFVHAAERLTAAAPVLESLALLVELRQAQYTLGYCYKGLGRFADAATILRESVAVAERCGHPGAIAQSRMILANLYHDLAWFEASAECFRAGLAPLEALASPRGFVEAYASISRLAVVLASMSEAEVAVARCEESARRSGLWRHRITAWMAGAELYLCKGQPDLAWPLVEQAVRLTGDRSDLLPDGPLYERLQRQFCWATRGYEALQSVGRQVPTALYDSLVDGLEVRLFDEAVARIAGDHVDAGTPVLDEAVTTGLLGPLARLLASGVHHPAVPQRVKGEPAAQLVARVFPHAQRTVIPSSVGLLA
jgi:DNA-binding SARP family transcriptional activator/tetratricopeptide (TPR) repeat protein